MVLNAPMTQGIVYLSFVQYLSLINDKFYFKNTFRKDRDDFYWQSVELDKIRVVYSRK